MRREWKNRSCCSARLSIFKRLKISIFRHQPRKRWGEAMRRDVRSKQALGTCRAARESQLRGCSWGRGHRGPWMWPQGDAGSHKRAAGLSARGDAQPRGRMLSIKGDAQHQGWGMLSPEEGCFSSQGGALHPRGCSAPMEDGQHRERVLNT